MSHTSLFPLSVAKHLTQLEELKIIKCGIVELIEKEGLDLKVVFPRLTSLKLKELTELKCICTRHALRWPALKNLEVQGCNKVEIFASQPKNEMPLHKQPLFLIEKGAFPNLQELKLDLSGGMAIWHGYFDDGKFFSRLRVLELHHFSKALELVAGLEFMRLSEFPELIGKWHSKLIPIGLSCNLRYAFNPLMAQCLANLRRVEIKECDRMEGVIEEEEGQQSALEKITFPNLDEMKLECLPNLTSFLSGKNQILECPNLRELTIAHCPKMSSLTGQSLLEIDHCSPSLFSPQCDISEDDTVGLKPSRNEPRSLAELDDVLANEREWAEVSFDKDPLGEDEGGVLVPGSSKGPTCD
ncbi:uncharacterized protein LOC120295906 [Eucalyptus grandis]|uniref:uncharacterized protein LOC120295906 n=1 Tax=Eucalyptus grandis TaxID=71139 RepID=UPI00192E98BC|nr:uncharacterized protein LOC120295906 [Eucalyptus grandis]